MLSLGPMKVTCQLLMSPYYAEAIAYFHLQLELLIVFDQVDHLLLQPLCRSSLHLFIN